MIPIGLLAGATVLSAGIGAFGATSAASTTAAATDRASQVQLDEFGQVKQSLAPYVTAGTSALSALGTGLGTTGGGLNLNAPLLKSPLKDLGAAPTYNMPAFDETKYKQSPGYKWELGQGLNAVQNSAAGKTGAISGNMLKALDLYGTGAASQDYWTAYDAYAKDYSNQYTSKYNNYWGTANFDQTQQTNQYNRLYNSAQSGAQAATNTGTFGTNTASDVAKNTVKGGEATAAGTLGATNAASKAVNTLSTDYQALYPSTTTTDSYLNYPTGVGYQGWIPTY